MREEPQREVATGKGSAKGVGRGEAGGDRHVGRWAGMWHARQQEHAYYEGLYVARRTHGRRGAADERASLCRGTYDTSFALVARNQRSCLRRGGARRLLRPMMCRCCCVSTPSSTTPGLLGSSGHANSNESACVVCLPYFPPAGAARRPCFRRSETLNRHRCVRDCGINNTRNAATQSN